MLDPTNPVHRAHIEELNFLVKGYIGVNKMITGTKNRLHQLSYEADPKTEPILRGDDESVGLESIRRSIQGRTRKVLSSNFILWTHWLSRIPGMGPVTGGGLVLLYYYKFVPICRKCACELIKQDGTFWCPACKKSVRGQGNTKYRIDVRDFPTISKWWAFLGMHCNEKGVKPRREKGKQANWSSRGRGLAWMAATSFVKQKDKGQLYRDKVYEPIKANKLRKKPDLADGHRNNQALNETAKIFLSHFWVVARTLDGLPVSEPYAQKILGHTNITEPLYWDPGYEPVPKGRKKKESGQEVETRT